MVVFVTASDTITCFLNFGILSRASLSKRLRSSMAPSKASTGGSGCANPVDLITILIMAHGRCDVTAGIKLSVTVFGSTRL